MSNKVTLFLGIVAIIAIYVVAIPLQTYRMGYNIGRNAGAVEWGSYGYGMALDTVTSILDKEIADGPDPAVTEIQIVGEDTLTYVLFMDGSSSSIDDSITNKIK
jgi:hypothetical protein